MSRVDCHLLDERLMDYLYEELDTREMDEMRAHVEGCPRCSAEIGRFRGVRRAVAQLEMADPPPAVSAKLLHHAAQSQKTSMWRRSRAMRAAVYATPIVAMAAAFMLLIHVKDKALQSTIHPGEVSVEIDGRPVATPAAAPSIPAPEGTTALKGEKAEEESGAAKPADDADKAKAKADIGGRVTATEKAPAPVERPSRHAAADRKVEFKPPVTKDTTLGKATVAKEAPPPAGPSRGAPAMHAAPSSGGEDFDTVMGGAMNDRRDMGRKGGGGKAGGDTPVAEPPKTAAPKPVAKPREQAKREAAPQFETSRPTQPAPAPPPPQAGAAPQKKMQSPGTYAQPQVTTSPPPASIEVQNEGYQRYRNAPQVQQRPAPPPAANAQSAPELDETRSTTEGLVSRKQHEEQKQATTSPEQLYSQLVTSTNSGNDCSKVMDLVKQLETWNYWGTQHPNEMRNAYMLRSRCQNDNNLANKDMENARRIQENEKNEKTRASKAGKKAPAKSKASDNAAQQAAPAEAAPSKK